MPPRPEHRLQVGDVTIGLDLEAGGRATTWQVADLSLLAHHGDSAVEHGMYPMAPWAGRLRDNAVVVRGHAHELPVTYDGWALHGVALAAPVDVLDATETPDLSRVAFRVADSGSWPWPMAIDVIWELRPRELTTGIVVHALEEAFPVVVGWHPWFARLLGRGRSVAWLADADTLAERGSDHLPTGRMLPALETTGPYDDAFVVPSGVARVWWPGALEVEISNDAPWFVVFDELPDAVCVEPQSGPPNGVNDGLTLPIPIAAPGRPHAMVTTWTMRDDQE
jgi:aldose 1-epimerase